MPGPSTPVVSGYPQSVFSQLIFHYTHYGLSNYVLALIGIGLVLLLADIYLFIKIIRSFFSTKVISTGKIIGFIVVSLLTILYYFFFVALYGVSMG